MTDPHFAAIAALTARRPNWRKIVHSSAYQAWLALQPESYRHEIECSWDPFDIDASIVLFRKEWL